MQANILISINTSDLYISFKCSWYSKRLKESKFLCFITYGTENLISNRDDPTPQKNSKTLNHLKTKSPIYVTSTLILNITISSIFYFSVQNTGKINSLDVLLLSAASHLKVAQNVNNTYK